MHPSTHMCACPTFGITCFARTQSHTTPSTHHAHTQQAAGGHLQQCRDWGKRRTGLVAAPARCAGWVHVDPHFSHVGRLRTQVRAHSCCAPDTPPTTHKGCTPTYDGCATRVIVHATPHILLHCHAHAPLTHPSARLLARCAAHHSNTRSRIAHPTTHVTTGPIGTTLVRRGGLAGHVVRG